ncbi:MAG: helix-turn-helix transcriptional regulator [Chthoniobacterales bacterium]
MATQLLTKIGKTQRLAILEEIKRSGRGLPVKALAATLKMSYMGVKDLCIDLEKNGLLKTWRNPRPRGRPEIEYRLTRKAEEAFPRPDNSALLSVLASAARLHGAAMPAKLLMLYFQEKLEIYRRFVRGDTPLERAKWLARARDREGHYSVFHSDPEPCLLEHHQPLWDVFEAYPDSGKMEERMIGQVLGCRVSRKVTTLEGCYEIQFWLLL